MRSEHLDPPGTGHDVPRLRLGAGGIHQNTLGGRSLALESTGRDGALRRGALTQPRPLVTARPGFALTGGAWNAAPAGGVFESTEERHDGNGNG